MTHTDVLKLLTAGLVLRLTYERAVVPDITEQPSHAVRPCRVLGQRRSGLGQPHLTVIGLRRVLGQRRIVLGKPHLTVVSLCRVLGQPHRVLGQPHRVLRNPLRIVTAVGLRRTCTVATHHWPDLLTTAYVLLWKLEDSEKRHNNMNLTLISTQLTKGGYTRASQSQNSNQFAVCESLQLQHTANLTVILTLT